MTMSIAATWHASKAIEAIGPRCHFACAVVIPVVMGNGALLIYAGEVGGRKAVRK